jgi:hypothetical protein
MNLDELKAKLPDALKPLAELYGPTILTMTTAELQSWLNYVFVGRYTEAYALYLKAAGNDTLLAEWDKEHASWQKDNTANAAQIAMSNKIGLAICQVMLGIILACIGF